MGNTFLVLGLYFAIAFVPKVPWFAKVAGQLILGAIIYFGFPETSFELPMADTLPISSLIGGNPEWFGEDFNKTAMGVVGTVLGLVMTVVATLLYFVVGKKSTKE